MRARQRDFSYSVPGCGAPTEPSNPFPPDDAEDQALTVPLRWYSVPTAGTGLGEFRMDLYFGTDPDPEMIEYGAIPPYNVGPLDPETTYYWRVFSVVTDFGTAMGPLWHFTTGAGVPVRESTWGGIKSLYAE